MLSDFIALLRKALISTTHEKVWEGWFLSRFLVEIRIEMLLNKLVRDGDQLDQFKTSLARLDLTILNHADAFWLLLHVSEKL